MKRENSKNIDKQSNSVNWAIERKLSSIDAEMKKDIYYNNFLLYLWVTFLDKIDKNKVNHDKYLSSFYYKIQL